MKLWRTAIFVGVIAAPAFAQETAPLSAIDWLSQSVEGSITLPEKPRLHEQPVTQNATPPVVTVTTLDGPSPDPVGLLPADVTGLPRTLWSLSQETTLVALVQAEQIETLPAIQDFLTVLMLAEADPPLGAGADGALFFARVDKLLDLAALEPAQAMLEQAELDQPDIFRRWFDIALLTGSEDHACDIMQAHPAVAPTYPARIFCLARNGDWPAAALTLNTHRVLGDVTPAEEALLSRFLDVELFEGDPALPPPSRVSPLLFRMREAIGEGLTTSGLPLAFAHADLRTTTGWKAQIEAAERLSRHNAISPNVLHRTYMARTPAASGGVWDRAKALQIFDRAVQNGDPDIISAAIIPAWEAMQNARLEVAFAALYANQLREFELTQDAANIAFHMGLLSNDYETIALAPPPGADPFLIALARGIPAEAPANTARARAIQRAFTDAVPPAVLQTLVNNGQLGEALLRAVAQFNAGLGGDFNAVTEALALLRSVGLEDVARKAALQLILLDRTL